MNGQNIVTLRDVLLWGEEKFQEAKIYLGHGTYDMWDEAVFLATHILHLSPNADRCFLDKSLSASEREAILDIFSRRVKERIPAPYLTNEAWFMGLPFYVDDRVLIPRSPIAEFIERGFAPFANGLRLKKILDIGTGSGCIAIASALVFPNVQIDASDISQKALEVAAINVKKYDVANRVRLIESDIFSTIFDEVYDLIISNPPYVAEEELLSFCRERLGSVKTPKSVDVWPSLPRSSIGKVLKKEIRKKFWEGRSRMV